MVIVMDVQESFNNYVTLGEGRRLSLVLHFVQGGGV